MIEVEGPTTAAETLGFARVLDHAVQRDKLRDDYLAHRHPPFCRLSNVYYRQAQRNRSAPTGRAQQLATLTRPGQAAERFKYLARLLLRRARGSAARAERASGGARSATPPRDQPSSRSRAVPREASPGPRCTPRRSRASPTTRRSVGPARRPPRVGG